MRKLLYAATALLRHRTSSIPPPPLRSPMTSLRWRLGTPISVRQEAARNGERPTLTAVAGVAEGSAPPSAEDAFSTSWIWHDLLPSWSAMLRGAGEQGLECLRLGPELHLRQFSSRARGCRGDRPRSQRGHADQRAFPLLRLLPTSPSRRTAPLMVRSASNFQSNSATSLGPLLLTLEQRDPDVVPRRRYGRLSLRPRPSGRRRVVTMAGTCCCIHCG